jgi:mono/diheme cytochrome c family protein
MNAFARSLTASLAIGVSLAIAVPIAVAQTKSTQDGVYSDAQAARGETLYGKTCASCHGPDLEGTGQAPALSDADFAKEWDGQPLSDLFERIHQTMPGDAPGTLKAADVADVLAFLLKKGRHPAGSAELPADPEALKSVTFNAKGPAR